MPVATVGEFRWDKISKASLICSHAEVGLSKATIAEKYERLAEGLIKSANEASGELATEGFSKAPKLAARILALQAHTS